MSGFVRKGFAKNQDVGTRPGLHGQTLISLGLVDFDRLLGGGLPLGTLTLLLEDKHSQQHRNVLRYFLAEAVATGQRALWISPNHPSGGLEAFLPAIVDPSERASSQSKASSSQSQQGGQEEHELRIAWQYKKYLDSNSGSSQEGAHTEAGGSRKSSTSSAGASQAAATKKAVDAGVSREWCHTYDLTRSLDTGKAQASGLVCDTCDCSLHKASSTAYRFASSFEAPTILAPGDFPLPVIPKGPESVGRLVVQSLGSPVWQLNQQQQPSFSNPAEVGEEDEDEAMWGGVAQMLLQLRTALQDKRCAAIVSCQAYLMPPAWRLRLLHLSDVVLVLDSISDASPVYKLLPDPSSAAALLSVCKLPSAGMLGPRLPDPQLYVLRNKRKRLALTPVEVDPQAEEREQEALTSANASKREGVQRAALGLDF